MKGWFDAFRTEGGPTLYSYHNRTPVTGDLPTITIYVIFFTLFIAFLIIFPGVRKERFTTFTSVTLSLFVGTVILVTNQGSCWHVSESVIKSDYISFSSLRIEGKLGVFIGLKHINVTLESQSPIILYNSHYYSNNDYYTHNASNSSSPPSITYNNNNNKHHPHTNHPIDYNERFHWDDPEQIGSELKEALHKGLPYPILTVVEYFSLDNEGFTWGRMYRLAGYYSSLLLWAAFASWLLMNLLLVVVPRYGAYQMIITSFLMLSANLIYYVLLPEHPLSIHFEDVILEFQFGWSYWLVAIAGALCGFVGLVIALIDLLYPHSFSTILEVDYDTPYDRHIIIEESFKGKSRARSLEDPIDTGIGFGRKILRTLSSKRSVGNEKGLVNNGFEMDPPKSPWANYNRIMSQQAHQKRMNELGNNSLMNAMAKNPNLARLAAPNHVILNGASANSSSSSSNSNLNGHATGMSKPSKSVSFRRQSRLEQTFDIKKRDDSDDESISNCSSHSDEGPPPPPRDNLHHFQSVKGAELLSRSNSHALVEAEDEEDELEVVPYPPPHARFNMPRVSYDSTGSKSNGGSRRGSHNSNGSSSGNMTNNMNNGNNNHHGESTDPDDNVDTSSLSGFSSNSFDMSSSNHNHNNSSSSNNLHNNHVKKGKRTRAAASSKHNNGVPSHNEYVTPFSSSPPSPPGGGSSSSPPPNSSSTITITTNNLGEPNKHSEGNEW